MVDSRYSVCVCVCAGWWIYVDEKMKKEKKEKKEKKNKGGVLGWVCDI